MKKIILSPFLVIGFLILFFCIGAPFHQAKAAMFDSAGPLKIYYTWPAGQNDLDTGTTVFGTKFGYYCGGGHAFASWTSGDDQDDGPEVVVIDLIGSKNAGIWTTNFNVNLNAGWYDNAGGTGPASIYIEYNGKTTTPISITPGRQHYCASTNVGTVSVSFANGVATACLGAQCISSDSGCTDDQECINKIGRAISKECIDDKTLKVKRVFCERESPGSLGVCVEKQKDNNGIVEVEKCLGEAVAGAKTKCVGDAVAHVTYVKKSYKENICVKGSLQVPPGQDDIDDACVLQPAQDKILDVCIGKYQVSCTPDGKSPETHTEKCVAGVEEHLATYGANTTPPAGKAAGDKRYCITDSKSISKCGCRFVSPSQCGVRQVPGAVPPLFEPAALKLQICQSCDEGKGKQWQKFPGDVWHEAAGCVDNAPHVVNAIGCGFPNTACIPGLLFDTCVTIGGCMPFGNPAAPVGGAGKFFEPRCPFFDVSPCMACGNHCTPPDTQQCANGGFRTCDNLGHWTGCHGPCTPGTTAQCIDANGNPAGVQTCILGEWGPCEGCPTGQVTPHNECTDTGACVTKMGCGVQANCDNCPCPGDQVKPHKVCNADGTFKMVNTCGEDETCGCAQGATKNCKCGGSIVCTIDGTWPECPDKHTACDDNKCKCVDGEGDDSCGPLGSQCECGNPGDVVPCTGGGSTTYDENGTLIPCASHTTCVAGTCKTVNTPATPANDACQMGVSCSCTPVGAKQNCPGGGTSTCTANGWSACPPVACSNDCVAGKPCPCGGVTTCVDGEEVCPDKHTECNLISGECECVDGSAPDECDTAGGTCADCTETQYACGSNCCETDETCDTVTGTCSSCTSSQTSCGDVCCEEDQVCDNGTCLNDCPGNTVTCGSNCCEAGQRCNPNGTCADECGPTQVVCGNNCCDRGESCNPLTSMCQECAPGVYPCSRCLIDQVVCGNNCCNADQICNANSQCENKTDCTASQIQCGNTCCNAGQYCCDGDTCSNTSCSGPTVTPKIYTDDYCAAANLLGGGIGMVSFKWDYEPGDKGLPQKNYRIEVSTESGASFEDGIIFDSGIANGAGSSIMFRVYPSSFKSTNSCKNNRNYDGSTGCYPPFINYGVSYYWRVKVWDTAGQSSAKTYYTDGHSPYNATGYPDYADDKDQIQTAYKYVYDHPSPFVSYSEPKNVTPGSSGTFVDASTCYDNSGNSYKCRELTSGDPDVCTDSKCYSWWFKFSPKVSVRSYINSYTEDSNLIPDPAGIGPTAGGDVYSSPGTFGTALKICDDIGCCHASRNVKIGTSNANKSPLYQEVPSL